MKTDFRGTRAGEKNPRHVKGHGRARRGVSLALAAVLTFEALFNSGVTVALADALNGDTLQEEGVTQTAQPNVTDDVTTGDTAADPVAVDAWDWTGRADNVALASDGITLDADALAAAVAAAQASDQDGAADAATAADALRALLPETIDATLDLALTLDPAADGADTGNHTVVIPGDTLVVRLPEGVTASGATTDVYQLDAAGSPTTIKVAEAAPSQDGTSLTLTFVEPVDPATGSTYYVGTPTEGTVPAAAAAGKQQLEKIDASVALEVSVSSALLADEASELGWTLQTSSADETVKQETVLALPGLGELAAQLGIEAPTAAPASPADPAPVAADPAPQADLTYKPAGNASGSASLTMNWYDNNDSDDKRPEADTLKESLSLTFSLDGGDLLPLNEENAEKYFGMSEDAIASLFSVKEAGVGIYTATASGLYTQVEDSNGHIHNVTWTLSSDAAPDGYHRTQGGDGSLNFQLLTTSTYTIVAKVGEEKLSTDSAPASDFVVIDGSGSKVSLSAVNEQPGWEGVWDAESGTYKLTAPAYGLDGLPIEYGLTYAPETPNPTPDDGYTVSYDNAASTNHGSSTTAVYDGGTATILRVGTTTFDATKQWLDAGDKQGKRPKDDATITFTLWRYSSNGDTATNAAQVTDAAGNFVTLTAKVEDVTNNNAIDLGTLLASQYPELTLEKYDNDGYAYYYGIREESSFANYTTVYGSVAEDGQTATDTAPNYTDKNGNPVYKDGWTRDTNVDRLIYNNGSIGNRLSGQKTVEGEKEWHVAAFADQLNGVSCTFTLQSRVKGDENAEWTNTTVTKTLTDFTAETLTKDFSGTYDLYDLNGNELEYRWIETGVEQKYGNIPHGGTGFTQPEEGEDGHLFSTFTLFLRVHDEGGSDLGDVDEYEQVKFTSETWVDENGVSRVRNTFDDTVDEMVSKRWAAPNEDGELVDLDPADVPDHKLTISIYDGDVKVAEAVMDGTVDADVTPVTLVDGIDEDIKADFEQANPTYQETAPDHLEIKDLPRYKSDGSRYTYRIVEGTKLAEWNAQTSYDPDTHETTIVNMPADGVGANVALEKDWVDGGDSSHRLAVKVEFYAKEGITKDGETVYAKDEILPILILGEDGNLKKVDSVTITEDDTWFRRAMIMGVTDADLSKVGVRETYLVSSGADGVDPASYEVLTYDEARKKYEDSEQVPSWVNTGWGYEESGFNNADLERVSTGEHIYEVSYKSMTAKESPYELPTFYVSNRRIGLVNISIEKTWKDGATKADDRPDAVYRISCDDPKAVFAVDGEGQATVKLNNGNTLPLFEEDPDLSGEAPKRLTGKVETDENGRTTLLVSVPKGADDENTVTTGICGLPKYDGNGTVVSYSVTEEWADGSDHAGYASSLSEPTYTTGVWHFKDTCTYTATNSLVGSRDVVFFKEWNDAYIREGAGQRPDINLTLYRVSAAEGSTPQKVTGYISWRWEALKDDNGDVSQYQWKATAPNLATYDANGYAYTYYAVENIPDAAGRLDYQPVTFRADMPLGAWAAPENVTLSTTDLWNVKDGEKPMAVADATGDESGSAYAMREGGTFVNTLENTLRVNGRKIWQNIPGDAAQAELPQILVLLQRRYVGEQDWPAAKIEKTEANGKVEWGPTEETVESGGVIAWTDKLDGSETTFNFTIVKEGDNNDVTSSDEASLPRYDADGRRYEYRAVEVVTGLIGTPALPEDEVKDVNVASENSLNLAGDVYFAQHGETGSFVLRNTYAPEQGNLTVKKIVDGARVAGDEFPAVTFTLYRYDPAAGEQSASKVDEVTITKFESSDNNVTGTATHTFEDLDVFTPNGAYWRYYVVEKAVDGYGTAVALGDLEASSVTTAGRQSPEAMSGDASLVANDEVTDITFKNTYVADAALTLDGAKRWDDLDNAFGTRPDQLTLTLTRKTTSQPEETIALTGDNLTWKKGEGENADTWTYTITGLEQWAPDGTAWTYTVTETLADGNQAYRVITGSAQKQGSDPDKDGAYTGTFSTLVNRLAGSASVRKSWAGDNNDEWGLRPASVTVELQARTRDADGTSWSAWGNAGTVLDGAAEKDCGITAEQTLAGPSWSHSWDVLPYQLKNGTFIQYRVVETKVGDTSVVNATGDDLVVTYPRTESYTGEGKTTLSTVDGENNSVTSTSTTVVTNTLDATELTVKKAWDDDQDKWGLRDKVSGKSDWTTTFYLQRSTDGITWEYVTKESDDRVKSVTVTGAAGTNEAVKTFGYLPAYDESGTPYRYRAVEVVPGGYALIDTISADDLDEGHATVAGDSSTGTTAGEADQTFTNKLETITLSGEKAWNIFEADDLVPGDANNDGAPDKAPTLALERTTAEDPSAENATWENVTAIAGQPAWTWGEDSWKWTYDGSDKASDLPKYDGDGKAYTYRVSESAGSVPGFYPTYKGGGTTTGPATADGDGNQTASTITNVATRFSLNKVSDYEGDTTPLCNVELSVMSADGATTYAVWTNGANGKTPSARVWASGTTVTDPSADDYVVPTYTSDDGSIIGLPAGNYLVRETGAVPDGYALAPDVTFHINADGSATQVTNVSTATEDGVKTITVKVTDPVFRGHVELAKTVAGVPSEALAGAKFELWRKGENGADEKIAEGITTGDDGKWASEEEGKDVKFLTHEDGKREHLSDGLLPGIYYFREVDSTPGAWLPSGDEAKYEFTIEPDVAGKATHHQVVVSKAAENEDFSATVVLHKVDATDPQKAGIDGVTFTLSWELEDGTTGSREVTTTSDGALTLSGLEKGKYTLRETKNTGYDMTDPFEAKFTIDNEDYDAKNNQNVTFNVVDATGEDAEAIDFEVVGGDYEDAHGIANERLTGKATLTKTDDEGNALKGATFSLQMRGADGEWADVEGKTGLTTDGNGQIAVDGLAWGTYRFVETTSADGYIGSVGDKPVTSAEFTIDRDTVSTEQAVAAQNEPTQLKIKKVSQDGTVLEGPATFTISGKLADGKTSVDVTTENGVAVLDDALLIAGETYTLTEKTAPAGYELAGSVTFTVDKNGDVVNLGTATGGSGSYVAGEDGGINLITATDAKIDVTFQKDGDATLDGATNPYAAAEFTITPAEGDAFADGTSEPLTKTTDANGSFDLTGLLVAGETYQIEEVAAPAGYELIEGALVFEVNADGTLKVTNQPAGYGVSAEDGLVTIKATDPAIKVALAKVGEDGRALPGAVFTVAPKAGTNTTFANGSTDPIQVAVDESTGKVSLDDALLVAGGTYTLTETVAPNGHEVAGWVDFTVGADGTVTLADPDETTAGVAEGTDGTGKYVAAEDADGTVTITATDLQTEVTFLKVSTKGGAALPGAEFTLAPEQGKGFASTSVDINGDGQNDIQDGVLHVVSDGQGQVVLVGLLNVNTDYTLTETKAPAGYELADEGARSFTFHVEKDGSISAASSEAQPGAEGFRVTSDASGIELTIADEPIEARILKQDRDDAALKGASFTLSGALASGQTTVTVRDADDGTEDGIIEIASALLVAGEDYTIEEIVAPDGHEVAGTATLHVNDDGSLVVKTASDGSGSYEASEQDGTAVITVRDEATGIELAKVGTDGATGLDATFVLKPVTGSHFTDQSLDADGIELTPATAAEKTEGMLLAGDTYTLTEKTPADGYQLLDGGFSFTVAADGTITAASSEAAEGSAGYRVTTTGNAVQVTAADAPIVAQVLKKGMDDTVEAGAVFTIRPVDGSAFAKSDGLNADGSLTLTSTGEDGVAAIPSALLIAGNSYVIAEVTAPAGYELAGEATFTVSADGKGVSLDGAATGGSGSYDASAADGLLTITATDEPVEIELSKKGDKGSVTVNLTGAEFLVRPATTDDSFADAAHNADGISVTSEDATALTGQLVAGNAYTITETVAPAGYEKIVGSLTFEVDAAGNLSVVTTAESDPAFQLTDGEILITATDQPIEVTLDKRDLGDTALDGAVFSITGTFANEDGTVGAEETRTLTLEGNAIAIDGLIASREGAEYVYALSETTAPAGYELVSDFTFKVDEAGNVIAVSDVRDDATQPGHEVAGDTITTHDEPIQIELVKQAEDGTALEGAEFTLSGDFADGTTEKDVTPGTTIDGLVAGEAYVLTETVAPAGYEKLGSVELVVAADGTVSGAAEGYAVAEDGVTVVATDIAIEARIAKVGENGEPLAGATFTIANADDPTDARTVTTGEDGTIALDAAWLVAGRTYVVVEDAAPAGYELAGEASFTVAEDGTVSLVADDGSAAAVVAGREGSGAYEATVDGRVAVITAADAAIAVQLVKVSGDTPLAGAEFELTPSEGSAFADGTTEPMTLAVNASGLTAVPGLVAGNTYELREAVAPAGYEINESTLVFAVAEDGTVTTAGEDAAGYTLVDRGGTPTIVADDAPIEAALVKTDLSGNALTGAEFTLRGEFANADGTRPGAAETRTVKVAEDGSVALSGLIAGEKYVLTETVAPEGYELLDGSVTLVVSEDGTLGLAEDTPAALRDMVATEDASGVATVTVRNEPTPEPERVPSDLPRTGDAASMLPVALAAGGLVALAATLVPRRRRNG